MTGRYDRPTSRYYLISPEQNVFPAGATFHSFLFAPEMVVPKNFQLVISADPVFDNPRVTFIGINSNNAIKGASPSIPVDEFARDNLVNRFRLPGFSSVQKLRVTVNIDTALVTATPLDLYCRPPDAQSAGTELTLDRQDRRRARTRRGRLQQAERNAERRTERVLSRWMRGGFRGGRRR